MSQSCIDINMFTAYFGKYISNEDRKIVEEHIASCNDCMNLFALATHTLLDPEIYEYEPVSESKAMSVWKSVKNKISNFINWSRKQFPPDWTLNLYTSTQTVPVLVRSENDIKNFDTSNISPVDFIHVKKEFNNLLTEVYIEQTDNNKITFKIKAYYKNEQAEDIIVYVKKKDTGPSAKPLMNEYASFEDFSYGNYKIILEKDDIYLGEYLFEINENGIYWLNS